jgi:hypothetical protein
MATRQGVLSPQMRSKICELTSIGWGYNRIYNLHPDIPISTIKSTVLLERKRNDNQSRQHSGAPQKLTEEQRDNV